MCVLVVLPPGARGRERGRQRSLFVSELNCEREKASLFSHSPLSIHRRRHTKRSSAELAARVHRSSPSPSSPSGSRARGQPAPALCRSQLAKEEANDAAAAAAFDDGRRAGRPAGCQEGGAQGEQLIGSWCLSALLVLGRTHLLSQSCWRVCFSFSTRRVFPTTCPYCRPSTPTTRSRPTTRMPSSRTRSKASTGPAGSAAAA